MQAPLELEHYECKVLTLINNHSWGGPKPLMYKGSERFCLDVMVMKRRINVFYVELIELTGASV